MTKINIDEIQSKKRYLMTNLIHAREALEVFEQELEKIGDGCIPSHLSSYSRLMNLCHLVDLASQELCTVSYKPVCLDRVG